MSQPTPPPLQASSPTLLPTGVAVPRPVAPPVGSGGQFRVDLERAPQAIRELEKARTQLQSLRNDALSLGRVSPPAADPVSLDAAQVPSSASR